VSLSIQNAAQSDIYTNCRAAQASGGIGALLDETGQRSGHRSIQINIIDASPTTKNSRGLRSAKLPLRLQVDQ
jgi:hypothetical protein